MECIRLRTKDVDFNYKLGYLVNIFKIYHHAEAW